MLDRPNPTEVFIFLGETYFDEDRGIFISVAICSI